MPITTTTDQDRELTIHTVIEEVSFEEMMEAIRLFWEGQLTKNVLWDFTGASLVNVNYAEARKIIDYVRPQAGKRTGGKTAFVGSKDLEFGMSRTLTALRDFQNPPYQLEVFRSLEKASQWLDQKEED